MRILVIGGYGLIGTPVVQHLLEAGHAVVALGRDVAPAARRQPDAQWVKADLVALTSADAWLPILRDAAADVIVNCAGALQAGARDDVDAVQAKSMLALFAAAGPAGVTTIIQISATRANPTAETEFMRTKGVADAALQTSALNWVILRPGLVISPQAYGGTALLRALAAIPVVQPVAFGDSLIQTVAADAVAQAVVQVVAGQIAMRRIYDLVEDEPHTLRQVLGRLRAWHGLPETREVVVPQTIVIILARIADGLGWLGWRSPLRTTAISELSAGVRGDPTPWREQTGRSQASLQITLRRLPSTVQERWFAWLFLVKPLLIAVLAWFWVTTGLVALAEVDFATVVLTRHGLAGETARSIVVGGALIDVALGLAILWRAFTGHAALAMIGVTVLYLAGGTLIAPDLWSDPLGPLVKSVPAMLPAVALLALLRDR